MQLWMERMEDAPTLIMSGCLAVPVYRRPFLRVVSSRWRLTVGIGGGRVGEVRIKMAAGHTRPAPDKKRGVLAAVEVVVVQSSLREEEGWWCCEMVARDEQWDGLEDLAPSSIHRRCT